MKYFLLIDHKPLSFAIKYLPCTAPFLLAPQSTPCLPPGLKDLVRSFFSSYLSLCLHFGLESLRVFAFTPPSMPIAQWEPSSRKGRLWPQLMPPLVDGGGVPQWDPPGWFQGSTLAHIREHEEVKQGHRKDTPITHYKHTQYPPHIHTLHACTHIAPITLIPSPQTHHTYTPSYTHNPCHPTPTASNPQLSIHTPHTPPNCNHVTDLTTHKAPLIPHTAPNTYIAPYHTPGPQYKGRKSHLLKM